MATLFIICMNSTNCWDFMECPEQFQKKCDAFLMNCGEDCWFIMNATRGGPFMRTREGNCLNCPYFKKKNPELVDIIPKE